MHLVNLREISVEIGKYRIFKNSFGRLPENVWCIPSDAAPGIFRKASETFLISDLYRVVTEIAEAHADIARSFFEVHYTPFNDQNYARRCV